MGKWFGGNSDSGSSHSGHVGTDGRGGFVAVGNDGVATGSGQGDPVDNLIDLASKLADQDDQNR